MENKIFALLVSHPEQEPFCTAHCFGDCGKISMGGGLVTDIGAAFLCFEQTCPHEVKEMEQPLGSINNEDVDEHGKDVFLRVFVTDAMRERLAQKGGA